MLLERHPTYSDSFGRSRGCHCKRGSLHLVNENAGNGSSLGVESVRQTPLITAATDRQDLKGIRRLGTEEIERGGEGLGRRS